MTTCAWIEDRLDDYLDGALDDATRGAVEAHLAACAPCAAEARALRSVVQDARRLPRSLTPPDGVWVAITRRLDARRPGPRVIALRPAILAAAAAILVILTATATGVAVRWSAAAPDRSTVAAAGTPLNGVEAEFLVAVRELERALSERRDALAPEVLGVVERSLRVIDAAIAEGRTALASDRENAALAALLWNTYRSKLDLLARATKL